MSQLRNRAHLVWQSLPQSWRRGLLFRVTQALAPRPCQPPPQGYPQPIIVAGFLTAATGLGEWARSAVRAFTAAGHEVYGIDLATAMMQGSDLEATGWRDGRHCRGAGTLMLHVNAPYVPLAMKLLGKDMVAGKRVVGCWAWELPDVPCDWLGGFPFVHEIWGLSDFTAQAFRHHTKLPVKTTPLPVTTPALPPPEEWVWRKPEGSFAVLTMFNMASGFTRKNPIGTIAAFQQAFGNDPRCQLVLKIANPASYPAGLQQMLTTIAPSHNITLLTQTLPTAQTAALIAACDTVVSLHRAEGFGLVPAEAMLLGKPVVATAWSGNLTFMTEQNSCLIPAKSVPADDPQATYHHANQQWAEPDIAAAAAALRRLRDDPAFAARIGVQGKADVERQLSLSAYAAHLAD